MHVGDGKDGGKYNGAGLFTPETKTEGRNGGTECGLNVLPTPNPHFREILISQLPGHYLAELN